MSVGMAGVWCHADRWMWARSGRQVPPAGVRDREKLGLVTTELSVAVCKTLKTNRKLDIAAAHDVLDLELRKLGVKTKLLDDARVLARRQA